MDDAVVRSKLSELRTAYKGGNTVDTTGLAAWGRGQSLDFVHLVVESDCTITIDGVSKSGREQLAQVVRCGAAQYPGRGYYRTRFIPNVDPNPNLGTVYEEMVYVAGGVFEMGRKSDRDGTSGDSDELPVHWVQLSSFYIGKYAVTQALWKKVMGSNPSNFKGDNLPVEMVSWDDITGTNGFLAKLNELTGKNYRLPTEAEWEYAARGCNAGVCESFMYSGSNTIGDVAWYTGNGSSITHTVGTKHPNGLGLYDMTGNVCEWCGDMYSGTYYPSGTTPSSPQDNPTGPASGSYHVGRGGSWYYGASDCRIANRPYGNSRYFDVGFRLV
jgi:formylglycine-generating enzyme required for sulfatase activity